MRTLRSANHDWYLFTFMVPKDRVDALEVDLFILMNKNLLTIFKLTYYNNVDILKVSL